MGNPFDLTGRTALVTGSSRGIGKAIAFALGGAGAKVVFHGTGDTPALRKTLEEAVSAGFAHDVVYGDIGDSTEIKAVAAAGAGADILVLNASVQSYGRIGDFNEAEFDRMARTNLRSSFQLVGSIAPKMAARGWGRVIFVGSVNQAHPAPRLAIYASTKAACRALALTAAKEYAPDGVTVNTITPGVIATDRNAKALSDGAFASALLKGIPAGRFGAAGDCAGIALALASEACAYIRGADILVDGGMSL